MHLIITIASRLIVSVYLLSVQHVFDKRNILTILTSMLVGGVVGVCVCGVRYVGGWCIGSPPPPPRYEGKKGAYRCLVWRHGFCLGRDMLQTKTMGQPTMRVADMSHACAAARGRARGRTGCHTCVARGYSSDGVVIAWRYPRVGLTHMVANNAASQLSHVVV